MSISREIPRRTPGIPVWKNGITPVSYDDAMVRAEPHIPTPPHPTSAEVGTRLPSKAYARLTAKPGGLTESEAHNCIAVDNTTASHAHVAPERILAIT